MYTGQLATVHEMQIERKGLGNRESSTMREETKKQKSSGN